jgi:hypothetical protein
MAILICDMELPATCDQCPFCGPFWWCERLNIDLNPVDGWSDWDKSRHPDCPLHEVKITKPIWKEQ